MENCSIDNTLYLNCLKVISAMQLPIRVACWLTALQYM